MCDRYGSKFFRDSHVKDLLKSLKNRLRQEFLDKHTKEKKGKQHLIIDNRHILEATEAKQQIIKKLISDWQKSTQKDANLYQVLDVQQRIAGTGSLGSERYAVLVEGEGSPDGNYLLDLKLIQKSSLQPYLTVTQPDWSSEFARVVAI